MCELTAFLDKEIVYRNVVYAKIEEQELVLKSALGADRRIKRCRIVEVDMISKRIVLSSKQHG
ncbi:MAG: CooT family nickel-binding protein [Candidatus Bathyarchaeota archaeon]|nr:CooT family nickel-binding protein [Candidatus Bathyarchaeota archaeon]